jgi:hypothetical protein
LITFALIAVKEWRVINNMAKWLVAEETIPVHNRISKMGYTYKITGYKCSECGKTKQEPILSMYAEKTNYCPNCGARMESEE